MSCVYTTCLASTRHVLHLHMSGIHTTRDRHPRPRSFYALPRFSRFNDFPFELLFKRLSSSAATSLVAWRSRVGAHDDATTMMTTTLYDGTPIMAVWHTGPSGAVRRAAGGGRRAAGGGWLGASVELCVGVIELISTCMDEHQSKRMRLLSRGPVENDAPTRPSRVCEASRPCRHP